MKSLPLDWRNIGLLVLVHTVALGGMAIYLPTHGLSRAALGIGLILTILTSLSISAGYHRLFSHRAYEAHPVLKFLLLAFGAGAFQNSALAWAADHRRHHRRTDSDLDPYDATRGFWYAHIGWVLRKADPTIVPAPVPDLERDRLVHWQHRHYGIIGTAMGVGLPVLLGFIFGDPWGGFIVGGAVRLFFTYHATFSINSFAHLVGSQPYSDKDTSRDSLLTAIISVGEGYHNFHHTFPADYRNGVRLGQFDPTKWLLRTLEVVGVARNLRRTPAPAIVRARLRMDEQRVAHGLPAAARPHLEQLRAAIDRTAVRWHELVVQYDTMKRGATDQVGEALASLRLEIRRVSRELRATYRHWQRIVRRPAHAARLLGV
jgi:stearoyl-CoA desaturase (delta-9 desaturase)